MKRKRNGEGTGSLDMLLDTMCNTFGGICFIALLVAILSNALPRSTAETVPDARKMLKDERLSRLARERDEDAAAVALWKGMLAASGGRQNPDEGAAGPENLAALWARAEALEEEIKKRATDREYNRREAERLDLLASELRKQLEEEKENRTRKVRTPLEHELAGWRPVDVWLKDGRLRALDDRTQIRVREDGFGERKTWTYRIAGEGIAVDGALWGSRTWRRIAVALDGRRFLRIYSDAASFPELCRLRDRLVAEGKRYNWHWDDGDELVFVVGVDSKVQ